MVMLAKAFAGSEAVVQEDADELKRTQQMSKAVQQELRIPASALAVASRAGRGHAVALSAAESLLDFMKGMLSYLSSRSSRDQSELDLDGRGRRNLLWRLQHSGCERGVARCFT
eukprot:4575242-Prymnesium_polylepis.1